MGNVRFAHIGLALPLPPEPDFAAAAISVARTKIVSPFIVDGQARALWTRLLVTFVRDRDSMDKLLNLSAWNELLKRAQGGDTVAIREGAYLYELLGRESRLDKGAGRAVLVAGALQGEDFARFDLIRRLSACGRGSLIDQWVFEDANAGSPEAQIWWAQMLIKSHDPEYEPKARELLQKATMSKDPFMRLWAAGLLATSPVDGVRDPQLALTVATALGHEANYLYGKDPDCSELLAAAEAASGHYADAVHSEREAIEQARALKWNVARLQSRLETYLAGRPWRGYLCDCDKLAPDEQ